jgi:CheY-like chemotaxis protein
LYVDDDADICAVVETTLRTMTQLEVRTAGSGGQALALASQWHPDLILLDVMMPGLDGPSTLERLRANPATAAIPVIFMTAKVLPVEVARFVALGAIGVIGKPFDPLTLGAELLALWVQASPPLTDAAAASGRAVVQDTVTSLAGRFIERTQIDLVRLESLWERGRAGDLEALHELEFLAHTIHGAGAIFDFAALSAAAAKVERGAQKVAAGDLQDMQALANSIAELAAALAASAASGAGRR